MSAKDSINVYICQVFGGLVLLPLKEFKEMEYMKHHLMNSMREELERRLAAEKRLEEAKPEFFVQHAQDDGWEQWDGPYNSEDEARADAAGERERNPGQKYRVAMRHATSWEPLEDKP